MKDNSLPIYALAGWGFNASIFNELQSNKLQFIGLDYMTISAHNINDITTKLSEKIPDNANVLGWSFGGLIAIKLAHQFPQKVNKLILLCSLPKLCADNSWQGICPSDAVKFQSDFTTCPQMQMEKFARLVCYPSRNKNLFKIIKNHMTAEKSKSLAILLTHLFNEDLRAEYQMLNKNILHFTSLKDAIIKENNQPLIKLNPKTNIINSINAGHADFLLNKNKYLSRIKRFIENDLYT